MHNKLCVDKNQNLPTTRNTLKPKQKPKIKRETAPTWSILVGAFILTIVQIYCSALMIDAEDGAAPNTLAVRIDLMADKPTEYAHPTIKPLPRPFPG